MRCMDILRHNAPLDTQFDTLLQKVSEEAKHLKRKGNKREHDHNYSDEDDRVENKSVKIINSSDNNKSDSSDNTIVDHDEQNKGNM